MPATTVATFATQPKTQNTEPHKKTCDERKGTQKATDTCGQSLQKRTLPSTSGSSTLEVQPPAAPARKLQSAHGHLAHRALCSGTLRHPAAATAPRLQTCAQAPLPIHEVRRPIALAIWGTRRTTKTERQGFFEGGAPTLSDLSRLSHLNPFSPLTLLLEFMLL